MVRVRLRVKVEAVACRAYGEYSCVVRRTRSEEAGQRSLRSLGGFQRGVRGLDHRS
jgi:hypothetical protein